MSLGYVLFWLSAMLVATGLVRELRVRAPHRGGWTAKYAFLAILGPAIALETGLEVAGHCWAIAVFVLLVGPGMGLVRIERFALAGRWTEARRLAATLRFLHPFDGYWQLPKVYRALELEAAGDTVAAERAFTAIAAGRWATRARIYRLRRREAWEEVLATTPADSVQALGDSLPFLARLRALGECGRREELLGFSESATAPTGGVLGAFRHPILLYTFAFYGEGTTVAELLRGPLRSMPHWLGDFWLATAGLAAGGSAAETARQEFAGPRFEPYREGIGALLRRRHSRPVPPPTDDERRRLDAVKATLGHESQALPELYGGGGLRKIPATTAVAAVLVLVWLLEELAGGSQELEVALRFGALVVAPGYVPELWRIAAANFLHFGPVHLAMNVAALFALGPFVEKRIGVIRYLILLAASGMGSMALTAYVFYAGREVLLVGASGAIMGLVGATAALLLRLRRDDRSGLVGKRLRSVAFILCLQFVFDFLTPKVSLAAHAGGALCGFAAALLIDALRQPKSR